MNELSLFEQNEKVMTTRELAEILGVDVRTVQRVANAILDPATVLTRVINGGESKVFTEEQATLIKQEIQKHHNLASRQIDSVTSELEENQTITNAIMILQRRNTELKQRAEVAESALARIENGKGCYSLAQTAKALKLPYGRNTLNDKLKQMGLLLASGEPYQDQINAGHFKVIVKHVNDYVGNKPVTLTTGKGLVYLAKRFNTVIDESIKADA